MRKLQFKKIYILYLAELLIMLALIITGILTRKDSVYAEYTENAQERTMDENGQLQWCTEGLKWSPGIYEIEVEAVIPEESSLTVELEPRESSIFRAILANELTMNSGQNELCYKATVTAFVEEAYLRVSFFGDAAKTEITKVTVYKTNQMYGVLAFCFFVLATAVNLLVYLYALIKREKISGEQQMVVWVLIVTILIAVFPHLTDYIAVSGETMSYLTEIERVKSNLQEAGLFRIQDLFLIFPAFLRTLGFTVQTAYRWFLLLISICTALVAYHSLNYGIKRRKAALCGTIIYMLSPYRISVCYNRGELAIYFGLIFVPLILCGVYLLLKRAGVFRLFAGEKMRKAGKRMLILITILVLLVAIYQVNDIAFNMTPAYLYHL